MGILKHADFEVPGLAEFAGPPVAVPDYRAAVMALGPAAYWRMGESSGPTLADETGGFPLQLSGAHALSQPGALPHDPDQAAFFETGVAAAAGAILPDTASAAYSACFWMRLPPGPIEVAAFMGQITSFVTGHTRLMIQPTGQLRFSIFNRAEFYSTQTIHQAWQSVALTCTAAGVASWYFNGRLDTTQAGVTGPIAAQQFKIGKVANNVMPCYLDEVAIFHHALPAEQVRWLDGLGRGMLALPPNQ